MFGHSIPMPSIRQRRAARILRQIAPRACDESPISVLFRTNKVQKMQCDKKIKIAIAQY
jgi:hypothetical protein